MEKNPFKTSNSNHQQVALVEKKSVYKKCKPLEIRLHSPTKSTYSIHYKCNCNITEEERAGPAQD